ncbi:interleukin-1 receptor type 1-like isoform X1 [Lates japonicus]|uniref:Interleukin-1 receptor type 1-like isoform X1 n=1 Tax=Lates japonicus TaxID=270547 RepID=A0AAD3NGL9_LATJO|nr:interleukin-1 receptor type 1-like isoform X1 [Lates japonicus]
MFVEGLHYLLCLKRELKVRNTCPPTARYLITKDNGDRAWPMRVMGVSSSREQTTVVPSKSSRLQELRTISALTEVSSTDNGPFGQDSGKLMIPAVKAIPCRCLHICQLTVLINLSSTKSAESSGSILQDVFNFTAVPYNITWGFEHIVDGTGRYSYKDTTTLIIHRVELQSNSSYTCTLTFTHGGITGSVSETIDARIRV